DDDLDTARVAVDLDLDPGRTGRMTQGVREGLLQDAVDGELQARVEIRQSARRQALRPDRDPRSAEPERSST
ncbi:hypothetical protein, partial [Oerskovia sp. Root918]|uniref:hypothetical protein n=1 Tax=Oerskovia sp. Root918 TaxID=1736607 RepID=UPI001F219A87